MREDRLLRLALVLQCGGAVGIALRDGSPVVQAGALLALFAAMLVALRGQARAAWIVAAMFVADAVAESIADVEPFAGLAIVAHAARFGLPIAVALPAAAPTILRVAASATFIGHGLEAIGLHPMFLAYIQHASDLVGVDTTRDAATILRTIGGIDLVVAGLLWVPRPRRIAAGYMSGWGTITALARTVYAGPAGLPDTLVRVANAAAPFALWLRWRR